MQKTSDITLVTVIEALTSYKMSFAGGRYRKSAPKLGSILEGRLS
jgi:hypothetical protein